MSLGETYTKVWTEEGRKLCPVGWDLLSFERKMHYIERAMDIAEQARLANPRSKA